MADTSCHHTFLDTTLASDLSQVAIVAIPSNATVVDALKILAKHNILCAPMYDAKKNAYTGLVDVLDLATFIVGIYKQLEDSGEATDFLSTLEYGERYVTQGVKTIADISHVNPFLPVYEDTPLSVVLKLFGEKKIHRLPVLNYRGTKSIPTSDVVYDNSPFCS
jgi:CBS domain-containing protein